MLIIIKDDQFMFSTTIVRGSLVKEQYTKEAFASKFGFILPTAMRSINLLDLLEKSVNTAPEGQGPKGIVITPDRKVFEYSQSGKIILRRRILFPGIKLYIRATDIELEEAASTFFDLRPDGTMTEMLEHVRKTCSIVLGDYVIVSMDDIQEYIKPHLE